MKTLFYTLAFITGSLACKAQVYTIPWAQVQPEWVFPLWFEDATGAKDTFYLAYNQNLGFSPELFGNKLVPVDTSRFQVVDCGLAIPPDLLTLKSKCGFITYDLFAEFCFWKCQLPLIVRWDVNLFRSSALPFPDQSPAPRAQALLQFDFPLQTTGGCTIGVLISDSFYNSPPGDCYQVDTAAFINIVGGQDLSYFTFSIQTWTGKWTGIHKLTTSKIDPINIYPAITSDLIYISINEKMQNRIDIYLLDITGRIIYEEKKNNFYDGTIDLNSVPNGVYVVLIKTTSNPPFSKLIIKQ